MEKNNKEQPWCFIDLPKFFWRGAIVVALASALLLWKKCSEGDKNSNDKAVYEYKIYDKETENNDALFGLFEFDEHNNKIVVKAGDKYISLSEMEEHQKIYVDNYKIHFEKGIYHVYSNQSDDRRNPENPWKELYTFKLYELPNINTAFNDSSYFCDNLEIDYNIGNNLEFGDGDNNSLNNINLSEEDLSDIKSAIEYLKMIKNKNWEQLTQKNTKEWIKAVQIILKALGYDVDELDWIFGSDTKEAIEKFQTYNELNPDGFPGPVTITELLKKWEKTHIEGFVTDFNGEFNFYKPNGTWDAIIL